jgi:predicted metalloprotease
VLPWFTYYNDDDALNARATPRQRMPGRADGTVFFGLRFLKKCLAEPESPDVVVAGICAHEFGHILQFKHGLWNRLFDGQPTAKRVELHADYLSGYFAGTRKLQKPDLPAAVFAVKAYDSGDTNFTVGNITAP